ncbi:uncharacterized protein isoform X2 [Rhodnius prolixus]|uniref:uncharacterized protein isoform X2 n=1 Tax=Rhodnius prolixus TaxID=13249 RepID=UPI003D188E5F
MRDATCKFSNQTLSNSNAYFVPRNDTSVTDSLKIEFVNESNLKPATNCTTPIGTQQTELNVKDNHTTSNINTLLNNNTENKERTGIILVLIPPDNLSLEEVDLSKSPNVCVQKFQEAMNISRTLAEMLFLHSNMSLFAISVKADETNAGTFQAKPLLAVGNTTIKFIGFVKPILRCATQLNNEPIQQKTSIPSSSTRKLLTTTITEKVNSDKIVFTKSDTKMTSPWGDLGVKTTRLPVDIIQNITKKHSTPIATTSTSRSTTNPSTRVTKIRATATKKGYQ